MKRFEREDLLFSLCGLNCGLCSMHLGGYCPGCGGGAGNQSCGIANCSMQHGCVRYCFECNAFPCHKYDGIDEFDSFITHYNQMKDIYKAKDIGLDAYRQEQVEKLEILTFLLENYNDGRRKSFFCIAVNLLDLQETKSVMEPLFLEIEKGGLSLKERAALAVQIFTAAAEKQDIVLKLRKRPQQK